jgi:hypothetical protein
MCNLSNEIIIKKYYFLVIKFVLFINYFFDSANKNLKMIIKKNKINMIRRQTKTNINDKFLIVVSSTIY